MILLKLLAIPACSWLYSFGGAKGTSLGWRRIGVPAVVALATWSLWGLLLFPVLTMGYGEDAWLRKLLKGSNILTRTVLSILMAGVLCLASWSLWPLLFIPWYVMWTAWLKVDDRLIGKLNLEELLVGLGIGVCCIL